jgi:hypothetical protein
VATWAYWLGCADLPGPGIGPARDHHAAPPEPSSSAMPVAVDSELREGTCCLSALCTERRLLHKKSVLILTIVIFYVYASRLLYRNLSRL